MEEQEIKNDKKKFDVEKYIDYKTDWMPILGLILLAIEDGFDLTNIGIIRYAGLALIGVWVFKVIEKRRKEAIVMMGWLAGLFILVAWIIITVELVKMLIK